MCVQMASLMSRALRSSQSALAGQARTMARKASTLSPQMVDVGSKPTTRRTARSGCTVIVGREVAAALATKSVAKGDVFTVSEVAGIMAAKRTPELLPLCHPLPLTRATVQCTLDRENALVHVTADVSCDGQTGVEMESLAAASTAALCIYDMCKPISKGIVITNLRLLSKSGGKSGDYVSPDP
ncbi:unnamed protein product [Cladocopium goreaui]|uniref:Cyclic pyranopterin monophosphate synthase n=1 Tax=Cladocopium goreaui TaxID=2562237 RepID=A0A9P1GP85_9DINO|nr:unnamed protein product [Cladocopium goreaui]